jgi:hypothetical protein
MSMNAQCACGQLRVQLPETEPVVIVCHCRACQRRTGAPVAGGAYYPANGVEVTGERRAYTRSADSGRTFTSEFCPICGTSMVWRAEMFPQMIGVALGAVEGRLPDPSRSIWECHRRPWISVEANCPRFVEGSDVATGPGQARPTLG